MSTAIQRRGRPGLATLIEKFPLILFLALLVWLSVQSPYFLSWQNISLMLVQSVPLAILCFGLVCVIAVGGDDVVSGGIDLSLPATAMLGVALLSLGLAEWHTPYLLLLALLAAVCLLCGAINGFLVLAAGLQVPWRLEWRQELSRLRPLNRKLLWVYYGYIGTFILTFGLVMLGLHGEMLAGERGAVTLLAIITVFWTARLVVDALVFEHSDWPEGPLFGIGHTLLTSLFVFVAVSGWLVLMAGRA